MQNFDIKRRLLTSLCVIGIMFKIIPEAQENSLELSLENVSILESSGELEIWNFGSLNK